MPDVRLVDLEVIKRYSLAVRREAAPASDVLAALDASRQFVLASIAAAGDGGPPPRAAAKPAAKTPASARARTVAKQPVKRAAKKAAAMPPKKAAATRGRSVR